MTPEEKAKQLQQAQDLDGSAPPQVLSPNASNDGAAAPRADLNSMFDPSQAAQQAQLEDKYGTGYINYDRNQNQQGRSQFQPMPDNSGSLYDPLAPKPAATPSRQPARGPTRPDLTDTPTDQAPAEGPIGKPDMPFRRMMLHLGYNADGGY